MQNRSRLIFIIILAVVVVPLITFTRVFQNSELRAIDIAFQLRGEQSVSDDIIIVAIDDESFQQNGLQWPWPRSYLADIVRGISAGNPAIIVIDVFFFEPGSDEGGDAQLAAALAEAGNVVLANQLLIVEQRAGDAVYRIEQYEEPIPELREAALQLGLANFESDPDVIVRRGVFYLIRQTESTPIYHWSAIAAAEFLGVGLPSQYQSRQADFGPYQVPLSDGKLEINYQAGPGKFSRVQAYQVANGERDPSIFENKIVLLGATTISLHDVYPTPFSSTVPMPGVEIMAHAIQTLIEGNFIVRWPQWASTLISFGLALVAFRLSRLRNLLLGLGVTIALLLAYIFVWIFSFVGLNAEIPLVAPLVALSVGFALPSVERAINEELERRKIRNAFGHYVSTDLVDQLARDPGKLVLGGERRELTFLFSDIRGFTTISERLNPEELTSLLNRFLTPMTELIMQSRGTIDKYMGDAIMAFWNAPLEDAEHARHACETALDMRVDLVDLNNTLLVEARENDREYIPIRIGVGINTGECAVGNFGSEQRFDYSVIGDNVNLASRLEGQSKTYGMDIVLGEQTREEVLDFATLELDLLQVKGKTQPIRVFALLGDEVLSIRSEFKTLQEVHNAMLAAYRAQDWQGAYALLNQCNESNVLGLDLDPLYDLYRSRIAVYENSSPGADWDGVFVATSK